MFQRLHELSQCLPERAAWERLNEGMPANCIVQLPSSNTPEQVEAP